MKYVAESMATARTDREFDPRWLVREANAGGRAIVVTIGGNDQVNAERACLALNKLDRLEHEMGNAAFHIETSLDTLRRRIAKLAERWDAKTAAEALEITDEIVPSLHRIKAFAREESENVKPPVSEGYDKARDDERLRSLKLRRKKGT